MKKLIDLILFILIIILSVCVIEPNIITKKESYSKNNNILILDNKSSTVSNIYDSLNMKLINNIDSGDILYSDDYNFMYFTDELNKKLSIDEKLYLVFNSLYKKREYENIVTDKNLIYLKFDKNAVENELKEIFGDTQFNGIEFKLKTNKECGIVDYVFNGKVHELKIDKCKKKGLQGRSEILKAYKKNNYIYMLIKSAKIVPSNDKYDIVSFDNKQRIEQINKADIKQKFKQYKFSEYLFQFELIADKYYLKNILSDIK